MWRNEVGYELQLGLDVLYDEGDGHFVAQVFFLFFF